MTSLLSPFFFPSRTRGDAIPSHVHDSESECVSDESILGDFAVLPPEIIEQVMMEMSPINLLPFMLSNAVFYGLGNSNVWTSAYARHAPTVFEALTKAPNPDIWKFDLPSSLKFLYNFVSLAGETTLSSDDEVRNVILTTKVWSSSALILQAAVYIIRRLAYCPDDCDIHYKAKMEGHRAVLGDSGVVESLLQILINFPDNPLLLSGALCALGNVVIDESNCKRLVDMSGPMQIVSTLNNHRNSPDVVNHGCFAIWNISDKAEYKPIFVAEGALDYAIVSLSNMESKQPLTEAQPLLDIISILIQDMDAKETYGKQVLNLLPSLFALPSLTGEFVVQLLKVLVVACETSDVNRDYAMNLELHAPVLHYLKVFPQEPLVFTKSCLALFSLYWRHSDPETQFRRISLIETIIDGMRTFPREVATQRTCAAMLSDLAHSDDSLNDFIKGRNGKALVEAALSLAGSTGPEDEAEWRLLASRIRID